MNAATLQQRIFAFGADESGIRDRFQNNVELYAQCFLDFIEEPHFAQLRRALDEKDAAQAFASAHALKGLSGNLGVTAFYHAVCALVESLRAGELSGAEAYYAEVERQRQLLQALLAEETDAPVPAEEKPQGGEPEQPAEEKPQGGETEPRGTESAPANALPQDAEAAPRSGEGTAQPAEAPKAASPGKRPRDEARAADAEDKPQGGAKAVRDGSPRANTPKAAASGKRRRKWMREHFTQVSFAVLFALLLCISHLFITVFKNYQDNVSRESASHIIEISMQLKLYVEEKIENGWKMARSVGNSILHSNFSDDDAVFDLMCKERSVWQVTDVMLYTADGLGICSDGKIESNDVASEAIARAQEQNGYLSVVDSNLIYTIPVETTLLYKGAQIVAVSVVQSMGTFLDDMGVSSFEGKAWMYLTEDNGMVISRLTSDAAVPAFNFMSVVEGRSVASLPDGALTAADLLTVASPTAFLMSSDDGNDYVVSVPIAARSAPLRLFYLAPESVVNETMNGFSRQLLWISVASIAAFAVLALLIFVILYRSRKKQFDKALLARERMFDLLVENAQTAFGLFTVNRPDPVYASRNVAAIIGDDYLALDRTEEGFCVRSGSGKDTEAVRLINERMRGWDGRSEFKSGYILGGHRDPPSYFELRLFPTDGEGTDFVGIAQDMTQAFEREQLVKTALTMAERANDAKSRFLSNMSHDIRTPMNAIVNMAGFAAENLHEPKKLAVYLRTIQESSDHLLRLINDVLDMSRIESGQTVIESAPFDIRRELQRQADMIKTLCDAKNLTFLTDFSGLRTSAVCGDQLKFSQVIMNLLSNAVKFTPRKGAVRFTATELPSLRGDLADMRFTVEDNGIGVAADFMEHLFEPFARADDRRVSRIEGTGLGLSICHSYVTAMGGVISCQSEEGEGSTFTVELFFQRADGVPNESAHAGTPVNTTFYGKRCLVGEDNGINRSIAKTMLQNLGFMVETAVDGRDCLQKFVRSDPGRFDVIYMDIQMPVMDGYQATAAIRSSRHPQAKTIPIVAMTANVFAEDIEKARMAGMDGHVGKPILTVQLMEETYRVLENRKKAGK